MYERFLPNAEAMLAFGMQLAHAVTSGCVIFLHGQLGAGKTTLARGFLRGLGYSGKVKSPTFTLVEPYQIGTQVVYHFDLYRLHDPQELMAMGIQDYFDQQAICLIEWPELGVGILPAPDVMCTLDFSGLGRSMTLAPNSPCGQAIISRMEK